MLGLNGCEFWGTGAGRGAAILLKEVVAVLEHRELRAPEERGREGGRERENGCERHVRAAARESRLVCARMHVCVCVCMCAFDPSHSV